MVRRIIVTLAIALAVILASPVGASDPVGFVPTGQLEGLRFTVVRSGDTLAAISRRTGVAMTTIRAANGMSDDRVYAGGRLLLEHPSPLLPGSSTAAPAPASTDGATHKVKAGETLSGIALAHDTSVSKIVAANGLADPNHIREGMKLTLPGTGGTASTAAATPAFRCPVPGGRFSNDWGFPRSGGRYHEGADLMAPTGTPIVAPVSGRVSFGRSPRGGAFFELVGADGTTYYGSHLSESVGGDRSVTSGETIGRVGSSGNAAGGPTHLHLEIEPSAGRPVNPYPFLRSSC